MARLTDRVEKLGRDREVAAARTQGAGADRRVRRVARQHHLREKVEAERARLTPEDQVLAAGTRVPKDRDGRAAMAHELLYRPDGSRRVHREIGAIMGLSATAVFFYFNDPAPRGENALGHKLSGGAKARHEAAAARPPVEFAPPDGSENFGARLARRRRANGWSKAEFARRMGVEAEQATEWEDSRLRPSAGVYMRIMEVLDNGA